MSTTKDRLNAVQEIINILEKFDATDREKILQYVNGESNIQSNKKEPFMSNFDEHMEPFTDIMTMLFHIFKESIEQSNDDKRDFLERLTTMNEISEEMGNYLKELPNAAASKKKKQNPEMSSDINVVVQAILAHVYTENYEYLEDLVKRIQEKNEAKDFIHGQLRGLREVQADLACSNDKKVKVKLCLFRMSDDCIENDEQSTYVIITKEDLDVEISNLEFLLDETRNKQQEYNTTELETFNLKATRLFSILSTVMKSLTGTNNSATHNIL